MINDLPEQFKNVCGNSIIHCWFWANYYVQVYMCVLHVLYTVSKPLVATIYLCSCSTKKILKNELLWVYYTMSFSYVGWYWWNSSSGSSQPRSHTYRWHFSEEWCKCQLPNQGESIDHYFSSLIAAPDGMCCLIHWFCPVFVRAVGFPVRTTIASTS